jgi:hypothetical protein
MTRTLSPLVGMVLALASAPVCAAPGLPPGTYRLDMQLGTQSDVPVLGKSRSAWRSVSLVTIRVSRGALVQRHRQCDARVDAGFPGVRVGVPRAFMAALASPSYRIEVRDGRYRADLGIEHVGYRPRRADAPVPKSASDPTIVDSDHDGRPGATLELSVPLVAHGAIHIVERARSILDGRVVAPGRVEGHVAMPLFEQTVIAAEPAIFAGAASLEPDPERSRFALTRIADGSSCDTLTLDDGERGIVPVGARPE